MMIPYSHNQTPEERYKKRFRSGLSKAKHLSVRMKQFIDDIDKSDLKSNDKIAIKKELFKFLNEKP